MTPPASSQPSAWQTVGAVASLKRPAATERFAFFGGCQLLPYHSRVRLSVCFLTRNQEAELPRALQSVAPVAAECLVVDTGSTDRTAAVAGKNGARVLSFAWEDDFSAGR